MAHHRVDDSLTNLPVGTRNPRREQGLCPGLQTAPVDANDDVSLLEPLWLRLDWRHHHAVGFPGGLW